MGRLFDVVNSEGRVDTSFRGWGNCWTMGLWYFFRHGGYVVIRYSAYIPVWHCIFGPSLDELYEFHPVRPKRGWRGMFAAFWHYGRIRKVKK